MEMISSLNTKVKKKLSDSGGKLYTNTTSSYTLYQHARSSDSSVVYNLVPNITCCVGPFPTRLQNIVPFKRTKICTVSTSYSVCTTSSYKKKNREMRPLEELIHYTELPLNHISKQQANCPLPKVKQEQII